MSENLTMRLLWAVLVGGAFGWVAAYGNAQMKKPGTKLGSRPRYGSMAYGIILPLTVLAYAVIEFIVFRGNLELAVQATVSFCFGIFLHISLYFLLLMLALPLLRKRISALACALLWMIPNYLYFISNMELSSPLFVFRARLAKIALFELAHADETDRDHCTPAMLRMNINIHSTPAKRNA